MTTAITVDDLKKVYPNPQGVSDEALQPYVDIGNMVVNEQFATSTCGAAMSQSRLNQIAAYTAAHFADVSLGGADGSSAPVKSEKLGEASQTYAVPDQTKAGYGTTKYGQLAMALDTCGILAGSAGLKAQFSVIGDNHIGDYRSLTGEDYGN